MPTGSNRQNGKQQSKSSSSIISRRRVLGSLGVAGAGFIAGCGGNGGGDGGSGDGGSGDGGSGDGGSGDGGSGGDGGDGGSGLNTLRFADPQRPPTLDPHAVEPTNTNSSYAFPEMGYESLLAYSVGTDTIQLVPALATEVPSSENGLITNGGKTIDFPLREGVMFHTGEEMTAEDVRYSWDRCMTMGLSPDADALQSDIDSMEVVDDYTFRVNLTQSNTPIFLNSTILGPGATIVSKAAVEENGGVSEGQPNEWMAQNSAGTGPFVLGDRTPNTQMWDWHEDYWGETGVNQVEHHFIGDLSSRVSQLGRGDLDYIYISVGDQAEVQDLDGVKLLSGPQINPGGINFNYEIPYDRDALQQMTGGNDTVPSDFFQDKAVRQAFAYAIPWESHIENILGGYGIRTNCVHVPGVFGYDPEAPQWEQDLDMVESKLKDAGYWEEGFRITLHNENISEFTNLNLAIKDTFESLNNRITINTVQEPESRAVERHAADPPGWPAEVHGLLPIGTDPTPYYKFFMHPDGDMSSRNRAHEYIDPRIPELITMTETETDQETRLDQFAELQRLAYEEVPVAYGYAPEEIFPVRECVEGQLVSAWSRPHFKHWDTSNC